MRRALVAVTAAALTCWLVSLAVVFRAARRDAAGPADAIVVLGAAQYNGRPSPVLRARLDHAADLWRRGLAPRIIVTGGMGAGDSVAEATAARRYLIDVRAVPESAVTAVADGRTSEASLRAAAGVLPRDAAVILVSDGFHLARLGIVARRLGLRPLGSPAVGSPIRRSRRTEFGYLLAESFKVPIAFLFTRSGT